MMNKDDFIKELARTEKITLTEARTRVDSVLRQIVRAVKSKGGVRFIGFGTFERRTRSARVGRNPQTGAVLNIPEKVVPAFKAGKQFEEAVRK